MCIFLVTLNSVTEVVQVKKMYLLYTVTRDISPVKLQFDFTFSSVHEPYPVALVENQMLNKHQTPCASPPGSLDDSFLTMKLVTG